MNILYNNPYKDARDKDTISMVSLYYSIIYDHLNTINLGEYR